MGFPLFLSRSRINFGRVIFPCFKWAPPRERIHPPWQLTLHGRALAQPGNTPFLLYISSSVARQAAFNYAMLLCRCIYVVHGSFFLHYIPSAHILAARPYVLRAHVYIYIYKTTSKPLFTGRWDKKWKWNACESRCGHFSRLLCRCSRLMVLAPEKPMLQTKRSRANYKKRLSSQLASYI